MTQSVNRIYSTTRCIQKLNHKGDVCYYEDSKNFVIPHKTQRKIAVVKQVTVINGMNSVVKSL